MTEIAYQPKIVTSETTQNSQEHIPGLERQQGRLEIAANVREAVEQHLITFATSPHLLVELDYQEQADLAQGIIQPLQNEVSLPGRLLKIGIRTSIYANVIREQRFTDAWEGTRLENDN